MTEDTPVPEISESVIEAEDLADIDLELPSTVLSAMPAKNAVAKPSAKLRENLKEASFNDAINTTADKLLLSEEIARAKGWALTVMFIAVLTVIFLPWLQGLFEIKVAYFLGCFYYVISSGWIYSRLRNPDRYTRVLFRNWGYSTALVSGVVSYCLGIFSPVPTIVTLGISFFGLGMDKRSAIVTPVIAIVAYSVLASLILFGVISDHGMLSSKDQPHEMKLFFTVTVPMIFLGALWLARVSRKSLISAVEDAIAARKLVGQREAQLFEIENELEQALNAGAGIRGRYTGTMAGSYELGVVIGRGGMGEVYEGRDQQASKMVAVKLLRENVNYEDDIYRRFLREGEIGGTLNMRHIVRVYDVGRMNDNAPYIVMELLKGEDLSALLRKERKLRIDRVVVLGSEVAKGIDAAHRAGVIHRDLKPQNIFLHEEAPDLPPIWKVLDFGVCKLTDESSTQTEGGVVGTPAYMAPEQARGEKIDHRVDIYSLGAVLYRTLTGRAPVSGRTPQFDVVFKVPPQPSSLNLELPKDLDCVLAIAMSKSAADRFLTAEELAHALRNGANGELDSALRAKGREIMIRYPWGTTIGELTQSGKS